MVGRRRSPRVLLSFPGWDWQRDEGLEAREILAGLLADGSVDVGLVDRLRPRSAQLVEGELVLGPQRSLRTLLRERPDVVVCLFPLPATQLVVALLARIAGARVVLVPLGWLGRDFVTSSWFARPSRARLLRKRTVVAIVRALWRRLAVAFVCASGHEAERADLPPQRTVLVPLPAPRSEVVTALGRAPRAAGHADPGGPVAVVARFDVHRKGLDRMCAWLEAYRDDLPRPAVLLLSPPTTEPPPAIVRLAEDGLLGWDSEARGEGLVEPLRRCRAMLLPTRYEGYPRVLREAVLAGLPVITTVNANFGETLEALATGGRPAGMVVDGDDVAAIQEAFEAVSRAEVDPRVAGSLLDRRRIGAYLATVLTAIAEGRALADRSYYSWAARAADADSGGDSTA